MLINNSKFINKFDFFIIFVINSNNNVITYKVVTFLGNVKVSLLNIL